ncbi:MAG: HD domain-containing protein [Clostridia bacterium]|nr:HD domain-containing protein [Clostridia bacterium]
MDTNSRLILRMIEYDKGLPHLIQHFLKVYQFAQLIGQSEGLDEHTQHILETAAIVHDIGIPPSLRVYGDDAGAHQEELGPAEAEALLSSLGFAPDVIARVSYLVGHHHTYTEIDSIDYQILVEADFLVNLFENQASTEAITHAQESIFATISGKALLRTQFGI